MRIHVQSIIEEKPLFSRSSCCNLTKKVRWEMLWILSDSLLLLKTLVYTYMPHQLSMYAVNFKDDCCIFSSYFNA